MEHARAAEERQRLRMQRGGIDKHGYQCPDLFPVKPSPAAHGKIVYWRRVVEIMFPGAYCKRVLYVAHIGVLLLGNIWGKVM